MLVKNLNKIDNALFPKTRSMCDVKSSRAYKRNIGYPRVVLLVRKEAYDCH